MKDSTALKSVFVVLLIGSGVIFNITNGMSKTDKSTLDYLATIIFASSMLVTSIIAYGFASLIDFMEKK